MERVGQRLMLAESFAVALVSSKVYTAVLVSAAVKRAEKILSS